MMLSNKKILVVGANGYIGSNLAKILLEYELNVKLSDLEEKSVIKCNNYYQFDFNDASGIRELVSDIDVIYFFAGKTGNSTEGFNHPDDFVTGNEILLVNLLNSIKNLSKKPKIIFPSTRLLYQGSNQLINEESPLEPKTVYSVNKLACENYLKIYADCFEIDYTIFRISLPYGSLIDQQRVSYGVLSYLINRAKEKQVLHIYGDGKQKGSLIHIHDLVEILIQGGLHSKTSRHIYNVGGPDQLPMGEIVNLIANKYSAPVQKVDWPLIPKLTDQGNLVFDSSKILNLLEYKFNYTFSKWLSQKNQ